MIKNKLAEKVLSLMEEKAISKDLMAERIGIKVNKIDNWEKGLDHPNLEQLPQIASLLQVPVEELIITKGEQKALEFISKYANAEDIGNNQEDISMLENAIPFLETSTIKEIFNVLYKENCKNHDLLAKLIRHLDQHTINDIAKEQYDNALFKKILPFISEDVLIDIIKSKCDLYEYKSIQIYLPYLSEKQVEKIVGKYVAKFGISQVKQFLPYISNDFYNYIVK